METILAKGPYVNFLSLDGDNGDAHVSFFVIVWIVFCFFDFFLFTDCLHQLRHMGSRGATSAIHPFTR